MWGCVGCGWGGVCVFVYVCKTVGWNNSFTLIENKIRSLVWIQGNSMGYGLWAKCTQLWPLNQSNLHSIPSHQRRVTHSYAKQCNNYLLLSEAPAGPCPAVGIDAWKSVTGGWSEKAKSDWLGTPGTLSV